MRNRQRDKVTRDVLQMAMWPGAGISKIMFCACLSHSQATAYLSHMIEEGLVINDIECGKRYCGTTPKGVEYLAILNSMSELLQMETKILENIVRCMDFGRHSACAVGSPVEAPCTE